MGPTSKVPLLFLTHCPGLPPSFSATANRMLAGTLYSIAAATTQAVGSCNSGGRSTNITNLFKVSSRLLQGFFKILQKRAINRPMDDASYCQRMAHKCNRTICDQVTKSLL